MQKLMRCTIHGRVQGVNFRSFARQQAKKHALAGFVKNTEEGTVTVVAEGEEEALRAYLAKLRVGPFFAKVSDIDVVWAEASGLTDFTICY